MKHHTALLLSTLAVAVLSGALQTASAAQAGLTPQQRHGRQIVTQNCVVCHLRPNLSGPQYGPPLNKAAANGDDKLMHDVIANGLVLMPGWKYTLSDTDINDVVAYVKTIPVSDAPASR